MSPQIITSPLGMLLELFRWLMVFLLMYMSMIPMGIVSVDLYSNCLELFTIRLAIYYSLYSNALNHIQQFTLDMLSPLLFFNFMKPFKYRCLYSCHHIRGREPQYIKVVN